MGIALANVIQALNPEVIVLGTIATAQGDFFLDRVRRVVRDETWPLMGEVVEIAPSPLGSRVGDYGAISVLLQGRPVRRDRRRPFTHRSSFAPVGGDRGRTSQPAGSLSPPAPFEEEPC